jgi:transcriptional regulator with XRE-family HTH domain
MAQPKKQEGTPAAALGDFIRTQRRLAGLSLREVADLARVSNPYLSQVERGQHAPSLRVLLGIADALGIASDVLLAEAGVQSGEDADVSATRNDTEHAIRTDPLLSADQKDALLTVYRSYIARAKTTGPTKKSS